MNFDFTGTLPPTGLTNNYSVRWLGQVQAQFSEAYTFYTESNDGVRLWVNGQLLIDDFNPQGLTENSGTINLVAGEKYDIRIEYFQGSGSASLQLLWSSPSTPKSIVPESRLSHETGGGFYDQVIVVNTTRNVTLLDRWVYYDPDVLGDIGPGGSQNRTLGLQLPADHDGEGDLQFTVITDAGNFLKRFDTEGNPDNANSQSITRPSLLIGDFPDLVVQPGSLLVDSTDVETGQQVTVQWTIDNAGVTPTSGSWVDGVTVINTTTGQTVASGTVAYDAATGGSLAVGGSATQQFTFTLPDGEPGVGEYQVLVTLDAQNDETEDNPSGTAESNNDATTTFSVTLAAYPDLIVPSLTVTPTDPTSGSVLTIQWTDQNTGAAAIRRSFDDLVHIENITTGQVLANVEVHYDVATQGALGPGDSVVRQYQFTLPAGAAGLGQILVLISGDDHNDLYEYQVPFTSDPHDDAELNNFTSTVVTSSVVPQPDLHVDSVTPATTSVQFGGPLSISWIVSNLGTAAASGAWKDRLYLSQDTVLDGGDVALTTLPNTAGSVLAAQDSYDNTTTVTIPLLSSLAEGTYYVLVQTDGTTVVDESDETNNVLASGPITLAFPPLADLTVTDVDAPEFAQPGQSVSFVWSVDNLGSVAAVGTWTDRVYLSLDGQLTGAISVFSQTRKLGLASGGTYTAGSQITLPNYVADGTYQVLFVTDSGNQVNEGSGESNNVVAASAPLVISHAGLVPSITSAPSNLVSGRSSRSPGTRPTQAPARPTGTGSIGFTFPARRKLRLSLPCWARCPQRPARRRTSRRQQPDRRVAVQPVGRLLLDRDGRRHQASQPRRWTATRRAGDSRATGAVCRLARHQRRSTGADDRRSGGSDDQLGRRERRQRHGPGHPLDRRSDRFTRRRPRQSGRDGRGAICPRRWTGGQRNLLAIADVPDAAGIQRALSSVCQSRRGRRGL